MSKTTQDRRRMLGKAISDERKRQRLSQRMLATMAGTNQSYLWEIENGTVSVGFDVICRLADALGVPVSTLISF